MKFRLDYTPPPAAFQISHRNKLVLLGSCFADNIGSKLSSHRFECLINPGGIAFNPVSVHGFLAAAISSTSPDPDLLLERGESCFSFEHHSSINADSPDALLKQIVMLRKETQEQLKVADALFVTFGSAHVYRHRQRGCVVANCHKQPAALFEKKLLAVEEITRPWKALLRDLHALNNKLRVIFTVSPVRYYKDGIVENNLSKATLLLAASELAGESQCSYFPAYELVTDDLRDYRFYREDLAHPNELAIDYVWEKFGEVYFSPETRKVVSEIGKLNKSLAHRGLHANAEEKKKLEESIRQQIRRLQQLEPSIRLDI